MYLIITIKHLYIANLTLSFLIGLWTFQENENNGNEKYNEFMYLIFI